MAPMKKFMFSALILLIAFEFISCFPDLNALDDHDEGFYLDLIQYFNCIGDEQVSCMPDVDDDDISPRDLFDKQQKCIRDSRNACQSVYDKILADFEKKNNKACNGEQCIPQPTIQTETKPEEIPERTLLVDSKELKRAEEGKCLTKGKVCRIPFTTNNSSYLIEDCCKGQFCNQILKSDVEFGQCCLQNDRNNCWLPDVVPPSP